MNSYDEDLQKEFEQGRKPQGDGLDIRAYEGIFRALGKEPAYQLPATFAEKVVSRVQAKQQAKQFRDYLWFAAGMFFLIVSSAITIALTGFRLDFGFMNGMSEYKGLVAFGIVFVLFLNWLDRRIVRKQAPY